MRPESDDTRREVWWVYFLTDTYHVIAEIPWGDDYVSEPASQINAAREVLGNFVLSQSSTI